MTSILVSLAIAAFLILLNGLFALAEFALVKVRATRLEELAKQGRMNARLAQKIVEKTDNYLSAIQLGITMTSLGLGWVGEPSVAALIKTIAPGIVAASALSHTIAFGLAFAIITSAHIILGEQVPKLIAIKRPDKILLLTAAPLNVFYSLVFIPMRVLKGLSYLTLRGLGFKPEESESAHSEEEMRLLLARSEEQGKFSLGRLLMFENLFDFGKTAIKDVMTLREKIAFLSVEKSWAENLQVIADRRFSRYPLCKKSLDDALGYVVLKDIAIDNLFSCGEPNLERKKRKLVFLDENLPLEFALSEFQHNKIHQALIKNSAGKITGLLTLENVIEEIVGEIHDELEQAPSSVLSDAFISEASVFDVKAQDRFAVIEEMLSLLHNARPVFNKSAVLDELVRREKTISCAMGHQSAFPHSRIQGLLQPLVSFGVSRTGIVYPGKEKEPAKIFFLILIPYNMPTVQLRILARLAGILSNYTLRKKLLRAKTGKDVHSIIEEFETRVAL